MCLQICAGIFFPPSFVKLTILPFVRIIAAERLTMAVKRGDAALVACRAIIVTRVGAAQCYMCGRRPDGLLLASTANISCVRKHNGGNLTILTDF